MFQLTLSDEERATLESALDSYLSDLRMEISDTDAYDFRDMLKQRRDALNRILEQLRRPEPA